MSGAYGSSHWLYDAEVFQTGQSLKFNDDDSAYLSRTPASAGNRRTWTWSSWVKRSNIGINSFIFGCGSSSSNFAFIGFSSDNTIDIRDYQSSYTYSSKTSQVFRDTSAWYHLLLAADMDNSTAADRIKLYVNGERVTSFNSAPSPTTKDLVTNSAIKHVIGSGYYNDGSGVNSYLDGYLFDVHFIDGQALDPTSFIKTENNQLQPKEYFGAYGTNGFRLNFQDDVISEGFNAAIYEGTNSTTAHYISGIGFAPNLVWIKNRDASADHALYDSLRTNLITSNSTAAEVSSSGVVAINSDGFGIGSADARVNSAASFVAWCWEAGGVPTATNSAGAGATPTAGSVKIDGSNLGSALAGSIAAEKLTANTTKGFSTGIFTKGSGTETVAHGLGAALDWLIVKRYTGGTGSWFVYHSANTANPETDYLRLNSKDDTADDATVWGDTAPTSTVFSVGSAFNSGEKLLFYAWTEISSYSKFGSYEGNANTTGPSVTLGFEPAFVLIKGIDANSRGWYLKDNTRNPFNPRDLFLDASDSDAEGGSQNITFSSTGFQITNSDAGTNGNGETFIYMAFADTREAAFFRDVSGNNNNFTPNNLDYRDSMIDTPLTNFCTFNPLDEYVGATTFSEGNLKGVTTSGGNGRQTSTYRPESGKWYVEFYVADATRFSVGIENGNRTNSAQGGADANSVIVFYNGQTYYNAAVTSGYLSSSLSTGDIVQVAMDVDNKLVFIGVNNTWQNSATVSEIEAGTATNSLGAKVSATATTLFQGDMGIFTEDNSGSGAMASIANFGQDSSFSGSKIPAGNGADGEDFLYTPPTGFKSLQLSNLPTPAIADPTAHFDTVLWTGNGASSRAISSLSFGPSFVWAKQRSQAISHVLYDSVRGAGNNKSISSDGNAAEGAGNQNQYGYLSSFDSNGFTASDGTGSPNYYFNENGQSFVAWNWIAGGATPSQTYVVKVVSDGGNKYRFDDFGTSAITLDLQEGGTYTFDQSDSSNSGHPFRFSTTANGTHGGGSEYTVGVTTNGTAGSAGAYTRITVAASAPTLYYYCTAHSGMGGQANTNSTHGSTNLKGTIQSTVSANTTAGFSIVSYTGTGSVGTIGHGFSGAAPEMILLKARGATQNWRVYHASLGSDKRLMLDRTNASENAAFLNDTDPTSTVFTIGSSDDAWNLNGATYISYLFHSVESFSKVGSYVGNGNADGPFIFTNFQVSWLMIKASSTTGNWFIVDTVRDPFNPTDGRLYPNVANAESDATALDSVSNGFKVRNSWSDMNTSGQTYVYLAFASAPFKTTSAR